jgi:uncharacterized protein (DUF488 family)
MITIWTIGHSTRTAEKFGEILLAHEIKVLVDVRSFPGSRRLPQFNKAELGGRRTPRKDSHNTAWKNASFRAYADHMESEEFRRGVEELLEVAASERTAVMCAEAVWWRCHRSLIADYLKAEGHTVLHIMEQNKTEEHPFTSAARIIEGKLSYRGLI